ncbi:Isopentenyl-diphosphate Delta-isomerase I [Platanthera guangdongensis]|uniref:Isopentenyl-diphosphate Delta-isomerase I n=1 Tax=Platanthera guangdongensis TaxID=2320717 RepID=A0ABR2MTH1_9ASPA
MDGVKISPWFRLVVDTFLMKWWDHEEIGSREAQRKLKIARARAKRERRSRVRARAPFSGAHSKIYHKGHFSCTCCSHPLYCQSELIHWITCCSLFAGVMYVNMGELEELLRKADAGMDDVKI